MEISKERIKNSGEVDDEYMCPKHEQLDCIMNMLDQSNTKVESLEKAVIKITM